MNTKELLDELIIPQLEDLVYDALKRLKNPPKIDLLMRRLEKYEEEIRRLKGETVYKNKSSP
jgi:hypothetical protein